MTSKIFGQMKWNRLLITLMLSTNMAISASAQTDAELQSLIDIVKTLRVQNETSYNQAVAQLTKDMQWTPMNETGAVRDGIECRPADKVPGFKLNRILAKVDGSRMYVSSHGDMLNGEDERYNYSLYERSLKAGKSAEYKLKGREGRQTFVIVPFVANGSGITATLKIGKKSVKGKTGDDGTITLEYVSADLKREETVVLTVKNTSTQNQAFAIINHNTRKK